MYLNKNTLEKKSGLFERKYSNGFKFFFYRITITVEKIQQNFLKEKFNILKFIKK